MGDKFPAEFAEKVVKTFLHSIDPILLLTRTPTFPKNDE